MKFELIKGINRWLSSKIITILLDSIDTQNNELIRIRSEIQQLIADIPYVVPISVHGLKPNKSAIDRLEDILYNRGNDNEVTSRTRKFR